MPSGRHHPTPHRPSRPLAPARALAAVAVAALAVTGLAAGAAPTDEPAADTVSFDDVPAVAVDGRGDVADRTQVRQAVPAPVVPRALPEDGLPEPLPEVTGQLWASTAVNVRTGPSTERQVLTTLDRADVVDVTGESEDGWSEVVWDDRVAWVASAFLVDSEPAEEPAPEETTAQEQVAEAPAGVSSASCATSAGIEASLAPNAAATYRAVCAAFPDVVSAYGGYRPGDGGDHGSGHALDIMVSGQAGWDIAGYLQAHAGELGITYLIFEQQIWMAGSPAGAWEHMADRGSPTANHYDHVHVSTS